MLKIGFMTTLAVNVGDEFIREGIRAVLDRLQVAYAPLYVNKHDADSLSRPAEDECLLARDKYWESDLFVQAGAPVYWHTRGGKSRSVVPEWHRWLWQERILAGGARSHPVFVNLGAGSLQPWRDWGDAFLADPECREFAVAAGRRASVTTVRDPVAASILERLQVPHRAMVCPAFLAAARHRPGQPVPGLIGVNLMRRGCHFDLLRNFDRADWRRRCAVLCGRLRQMGRIVFICHNDEEVEFAGMVAEAGERVFVAAGWRAYLDIYAACEVVIANRVHGAVCAAGFGVPALIMGNDTRAQIGTYLGLPIFCSADCSPEAVVDRAADLLNRRAAESARLLELREASLVEYCRLLEPVLAATKDKSRAAA